MSEDPFDEVALDLSPLDPSRDRVRWEALIDSIADRAVAARRPAPTLLGQLVAWSRPALALAAAAALALWLEATIPGGGHQKHGANAEPSQDTTAMFADWALGEQTGSAWQNIALAGGEDGE